MTMYQPTTPAPAPRKPRWFARKVVVVPAALVAGIIIGASMGGSKTAPAAAAAPAASVPSVSAPASVPAVAPVSDPTTVAAPPAPAGPMTTFGNGTYLVGDEVAPGKYRSAGVDGSMCYWDLTNDAGTIVDQGVATEGPSRATLKAGLTFKSSGCSTWNKG